MKARAAAEALTLMAAVAAMSAVAAVATVAAQPGQTAANCSVFAVSFVLFARNRSACWPLYGLCVALCVRCIAVLWSLCYR